MDTLTQAQRSERMSRVRNKNTKPEMVVRRLVHAMGYRYRLHRANLAGRPDLVFPRTKKVIFVHGCFWHRHPDPSCRLARLPKTRLDFWGPKLGANQVRDASNLELLRQSGWDALVVWECQLKNVDQLRATLTAFLESKNEGNRAVCRSRGARHRSKSGGVHPGSRG
ncbi:very short patch repair endonuclease [Bradyrhizobium sp. RT9b]|uniref:very short patch repair endonuclease n=1 Tax=Bradyrhizobium sp. RT9b TaxID=3156385 RepID=UPI00339849C7